MPTSFSDTCNQMFFPPKQFADDALEREFLKNYCKKFSVYRRVAILVGAFSWVSFIAWDYYNGTHDQVFGKVLLPILYWRLLGFIFLLMISVFSITDKFSENEKYATYLLVFGNAVMYGVAYIMMFTAPIPYDFLYYHYAVLIVMLFGFSMLRIRSRPVTHLMVIYLMIALILFRYNDLKAEQYNSSAASVYLLRLLSLEFVMAIIGHIVGIQNERAERSSYSIENELKNYNDIVLKRNVETENLNLALEKSNHEIILKTNALIEIKEKMRADAEYQNHEKSYFLANAVHDLRQPIQAIGNVLEPLKQSIHQQDNELTLKLIDLAQDATTLMRTQLGAILEISRLESGFVKPDLTGFDLAPVINNIFHQLEPAAKYANVKLRFNNVMANDIYVLSDKIFFTRIIQNIINNGIKYRRVDSLEERFVELRILSLATCIRIEIEDNGIGIPEKYLRSGAIFKPFFQLDNQRVENEKGVGLGLSIVNTMLAMLPDHRLEVDSELGKGSTFALEFPRPSWGTWTWDVDHFPVRNSESTIQIHGKYILVIEDDHSVLTSTVELLKVYGALVEGFLSLEDLQAAIATMERVPDLVLSDYRLPNGFTAFDVFGVVEINFEKVPFLILTADTHVKNIAESNGKFKVLAKPISATALLQAIATELHPLNNEAEVL